MNNLRILSTGSHSHSRKAGLCLSLSAFLCLLSSGADAAGTTYEIKSLRSMAPYIARWQSAILKKDVARAQAAAEAYEARWQGLEVYINHRSLPLYRDMEIDTQFAIDAELQKEQPDFKLMKKLVIHLNQDLTAAIQMALTGPQLSPLFDDLDKLRSLRGSTLLVIRDKLGATEPDIAAAKAAYAAFKKGLPAVNALISFRSTEALADIQSAVASADSLFADPNATVEQLKAAYSIVNTSYGYGVNLLNAAARTSLLSKTALTDADKNNLTKLNQIKVALAAGSASAGDTGVSSSFAGLQSTLEGLGRSINAVGTLRVALLAYNNAVQTTPSDTVAIAKAQKSALQAVALTEQALVGQFWGTTDLKSFLASLPSS